ncbi:MAG: NAD(P)-dependent oxidoreductase [Alphaproteobacteria bacterium]
MDVGVIGLGHVGQALALNLATAGYRLTVFDVNGDAMEPLRRKGASSAPSPKMVAEASDIVITSLPSPAASAQVVLGDDGILKGLRPGATWIETSTTEPDEMRRLGAQVMAHGIDVLEAPLSGGVHKAKSGRITMLVGGEVEVFERHKAFFGAISGRAIHIGALGKASEIKIITNMMMFINSIGMGEGLMLAKRAGIDLRVAYEALCATVGNSWVFENEAQLVLSGSYNIEYTMALAAKDLGLAQSLGRKYGVPLEIGSLTEKIYSRARAQYGDDAWSTMVVKLLEDALAEPLRAPGFPERLADE